MDPVDRKILLKLLVNARTPQRKIAEDVGISPQAMNYRMFRLKEMGIIKGFALHLRPELYGKVNCFAAFKGDSFDTEEIVSRFRCFEEITIYEFISDSQEGLEELISKASEILGPPIMKYVPEPVDIGMRISDIDRRIIDTLKEDPRMSISDAAKVLDYPAAVVRKRLALLEKNRIITVMAEIDLSKIESVLYSVISRSVKTLVNAAKDQIIFLINDRDDGILVCFSDNLKSAKSSIARMRKLDPDVDVMIVYEYELRKW